MEFFHTFAIYDQFTLYKTYAAEYKILFQNGLIDKESYRSIPKSTRNEWKHKNFDNIYGVNEIEDLILHYKTIKENRIARSTLYGLILCGLEENKVRDAKTPKTHTQSQVQPKNTTVDIFMISKPYNSKRQTFAWRLLLTSQ